MAEHKNLVPGRQASLIERLKVTPKIKVGKHELTFQPDELDEFYKNKARTELREIPEVVDISLRELREYIRGEPGLVVPEEEEYLIKFLRPCKWYAKSAFELMKRFYKYRLSHPRICEGLVPSKEKAIFISGILTPLPLRCNSGERILLLESGRKWKPKEISLEQIFKGVMLALEAAMAEPTTQVAGVRVILDMDGLSLSQVTYFNPSFASAVLEWVQKCLPCRLKGVHIVNQPYIFNMVFTIFKPFFQEKLRKRLHFHGSDRASLLSFIDAKALPTQYGGQLELPSEPLGETLWEYFCTYEEDFQGIDFPHIAKDIAKVRICIQHVVGINLMGLLGSQSGTYFRCWIGINSPDEVNGAYYSSSMTRDMHFFQETIHWIRKYMLLR